LTGAGQMPERDQRHKDRSPIASSSAACLEVNNSGTIAAGPAAWGVGVAVVGLLGVAIGHPLPHASGVLCVQFVPYLGHRFGVVQPQGSRTGRRRDVLSGRQNMQDPMKGNPKLGR